MLQCRYGASCTRQSTCSFAHPEVRDSIPCKFGSACTKATCTFSHPGDKLCSYGAQCANAQCKLIHPEQEMCYNERCDDPNCRLQHLIPSPQYNGAPYYDSPNRNSPIVDSYLDQPDSRFPGEKETRLCRFGDKCTNSSCTFSHPLDNWGYDSKPCRYGERCMDPKCQFSHLPPPVEGPRLLQPLPPKPKGCKLGTACTDLHCPLLHLNDDPQPLCPNGDACTDPNCAEVHPDGMDPPMCVDGAKCSDLSCMLTHPSPKTQYERMREPHSFSSNANSQTELKQCRWGTGCSDPRCTFSHLAKPSKQVKPCRYGAQCTDNKCAFLHPDDKDEGARPLPRHNRYIATLEFIFKDCNLACDMRLRRLIERGFGGQPGDLDDDASEPDDEVHWKVDANTNSIRNNWREGGWVYLPALLEWHPDTQNLDMDIRAVAAKLKHKPDATIEVSSDFEWIRRKGNKMLPPKRLWKWRQGYTVEDGFNAFTVATWNLQADMTRTNSDGTNRSLLALGKRQILQGLGMPPQLSSPGICCLQELQTMGSTAEAGPGSKYDHASGMVKLLEAQGYGGRLYPSMKNTIGIFWKSSEFNLEEEHILSYSISYKGALFVLLRHLPTRRRVMVATTHLSVPVDKFSKFIGFKPLLEITECLKEIIALRKQWTDEHGPPPLILAGDFNSEVDSSVYQLLTKGSLEPDNVDVQVAKSYGLKVELPLVIPPLPFSSTLAEVLGKEPDYTNVNAEMDFVATLDYIMQVGLRVEGTLDVFLEQPRVLPNEQVPSDHMPLCSLFSFLPSSTPVMGSPTREPITPSAVTVASANKRTFTLPSPTQNIMRQRENNSTSDMFLPPNSSPIFTFDESSPAPSPVKSHEASAGVPRSSSHGSVDGPLESPMRLSKRLQKLISVKEPDRDPSQVSIHMQESAQRLAARPGLSYEAYPNFPDTNREPAQRKGAGLVYENYSSIFDDYTPRLSPARPSGFAFDKPATYDKPPQDMKQRRDKPNDDKSRKPIQRLVQLRPDGSPRTSPAKQRKDRLIDSPETVRILKAPSASERTVLGTMRTENESIIASDGYNRDLVRQRHEAEQIDVPRHKEEAKARDREHRRARRGDENDKREDSKGGRERPKIIVVDGQAKERRDSERRDSSKEPWKDRKIHSAPPSPAADHIRTLIVKPSPPTDRPVLPRPASAHSVDAVRILKSESRPVLPKPRSASSSPSMSALTPPFTSTALSRSWSPKISSLSSSSPQFASAGTPPKPKPIFTVRTLKPQVTAK